jgi:hypothetical protein
MPTKARREDMFIKLFLSAYENQSWADAEIDWLDRRIDGAVEVRATRKSDGKSLAIEHTVIEPFVGEKQDFAFFEAALLKIEEDTALAVPERWTQAFVPVGTLRGQPKRSARIAIVEAVRSWLRTERLLLPEGESERRLTIPIPGDRDLDITLYVKIVPLPGPGDLHIRRHQTESNLGQVVEKALRRKLPKLVNTLADKRILLHERQHMTLTPRQILREIEKRRPSFPNLAGVEEIWIIETIFYETAFGGTYVRFELHKGDKIVAIFDFKGGKLLTKFEDGITEVVHRVSASST